jgi:uncharacterized protein YcbK (DUF882 family)
MKYFNRDEFACNCGCGDNNTDAQFIAKLSAARHRAGIPFVISSGYRCIIHNKAVGGKKDSAHRHGVACDIHVADSRSRYKILESLLHLGFHRIGVAKTFIHVDNDISKDKKVVWVY